MPKLKCCQAQADIYKCEEFEMIPDTIIFFCGLVLDDSRLSFLWTLENNILGSDIVLYNLVKVLKKNS